MIQSVLTPGALKRTTFQGVKKIMGCDVSLLAGIDYFELLQEDDLLVLANVVDAIKVNTGEILFHAGEPGDSLFVVRSGSIELFIKDTVGQKIVLTIAEEGSLFGELALLDSGPRTATAVALTDTELLVLDREDLTLLFQRRPDAALSILAAMSSMTRKADELLRTRVSRNVNEEMEEHTTALQRVADWIAWFSGSMPFLIINAVWFVVWILINTVHFGIRQFDPYPFGLLTMMVSLEAIFLSCFVLVSQNRQAEKDRVRADVEYEVNVKAELEVAHLHEKTDRIYENMMARFAKLEKLMTS
jgi:CRP/FNR family transcriptional regulator, cyclic AMP receptor protein